MKTIKALGLLGLAVSACFAAQAFATTCPVAPATGQQTMGSPVCIAPYGTDGAGTGLVNIFAGTSDPSDVNSNSIFSSGPGINPYTDQTSPASYWAISGSGVSENTVILTMTANAPGISFGIFDPTDPSNQLMLFDGGTPGSRTSLSYDPTNRTFIATYGVGTSSPSASKYYTFGDGNLFGYYLDVPQNHATFYSDMSLNKDGIAHVATYAGNGQNTLKLTDGVFNPGEFLMAWEDTPFANSDLDYNDFIVMIESVHPVPEPADLAIFGFGILLVGGFVALRRRRLNA